MNAMGLISIVFICLVSNSVLQSQTWKKTNGPSGSAHAYDIEIDPTNQKIIYVGTNRGIYKTENAAESWYELTNGISTDDEVLGIEIDYTNHSVIYANTHQSLYKSTDGGDSWQTIIAEDEKGQLTTITIDPYDNSVLYCAAQTPEGNETKDWMRSRLWKTSDSGNTWQVIFSDTSSDLHALEILNITVSPHDSNSIYCGTAAAGLIVSKDRGKNWTYMFDGTSFTGLPILGFSIYPKDPNVMYIGTDAKGYTDPDPLSISICYKTTDGGANWFAIIPPHESSERVRRIHIHPEHPDTIYIGGDRLLLSSYDGGETFRNEISGLNYITAGCWTANLGDHEVIFTDPPTIYSAGYGLYKSTDGGENFKFSDNGIKSDLIRSILVDPYRPERVYSFSRNGHGNLYTTDGGDSWIGTETPILDNYGMIFAIDPSNSDNVYITTGTGLYKSNDAGRNWEWVNAQFQHAHVHGVAVHPFDGDIIYVGTGSGINPSGQGMFKTTDGGKTWLSINNGFPDDIHVADIRIHPFDPEIVYLATRGNMKGPDEPDKKGDGVYKSTNGGKKWFSINNGLRNPNITALVINPQNPDILYVSAASEKLLDPIKGGVFKSTNGGDSWTEVSSGLVLPDNYISEGNPDPLHVHHIAIDPAHPETLYAGVMHPIFENNRGAMFRTTNGGNSWHLFSDGLLREGSSYYQAIEYIDLAPTGDVVYAAIAGGHVYKYGEFPTEDTTPPVIISGPAITYKTLTSVTIKWHTHEKSTSIVEYGSSGSYGFSVQSDTLTLHHSVTLNNLDNSQTYHFRVGSIDEIGNGPKYSRDLSFNFDDDKQAPQIISITEIDDTYQSGPYPIEANVTDNFGLKEVILSYSFDGQNWQTLSMNNSGEGTYSTDIPDPFHSESEYIDYFVTATDIIGNVTKYPALGPYVTYSFKRFDSNKITIPYIYFKDMDIPKIKRYNINTAEIKEIDFTYQADCFLGSITASPDNTILVTTCGENLSIIDNFTGEIKGTVNINDPDVRLGKSVISPDNKYAYSIKNALGLANKISVVNLETLSAEPDIEDEYSKDLIDIGISNDGSSLYILSYSEPEEKSDLVVYDLDTKTRTSLLNLSLTNGLAFSDDGNFLYTLTTLLTEDSSGNYAPTKSLIKLDLNTNTIMDTLEITYGAVMHEDDLIINRKGNALIVLLNGDSFNFIDLNSLEIVGYTGISSGTKSVVNNFALTEDDEYIYLPVPDEKKPKVLVYDLKDNVLSETLDIGMLCKDLVFTVAEITNSPPLSFNLISPTNNDTVSAPINFQWAKSTDENSDVKYHLYIGADENFNEKAIISNIQDTTFHIEEGFMNDTRYWWKVFAEDGYGAETQSSETFRFVTSITTGLEDQILNIPAEFYLSPNYPNPFNPTTTIKFGVKNACHVKISTYNITGQEIQTFVDEFYEPGIYQMTVNMSSLSSGIYFYTIEMDKFKKTRKMLFIR